MSSTTVKLHSTIMEQKVTARIESQNKQALGQSSFRPKYSMIDHLVTLRVIMEERLLQGKTICCCFVNFKKHLIQYHEMSFGIDWCLELAMSLE